MKMFNFFLLSVFTFTNCFYSDLRILAASLTGNTKVLEYCNNANFDKNYSLPLSEMYYYRTDEYLQYLLTSNNQPYIQSLYRYIIPSIILFFFALFSWILCFLYQYEKAPFKLRAGTIYSYCQKKWVSIAAIIALISITVMISMSLGFTAYSITPWNNYKCAWALLPYELVYGPTSLSPNDGTSRGMQNDVNMMTTQVQKINQMLMNSASPLAQMAISESLTDITFCVTTAGTSEDCTESSGKRRLPCMTTSGVTSTCTASTAVRADTGVLDGMANTMCGFSDFDSYSAPFVGATPVKLNHVNLICFNPGTGVKEPLEYCSLYYAGTTKILPIYIRTMLLNEGYNLTTRLSALQLSVVNLPGVNNIQNALNNINLVQNDANTVLNQMSLIINDIESQNTIYTAVRIVLIIFYCLVIILTLSTLIFVFLVDMLKKYQYLSITRRLFWAWVVFSVFLFGFGCAWMTISPVTDDYCRIFSSYNFLLNPINPFLSNKTTSYLQVCLRGNGDYSSFFNLNTLTSNIQTVINNINSLKPFFSSNGVQLPILYNFLINNITGACSTPITYESAAPYYLQYAGTNTATNQVNQLELTCGPGDEVVWEQFQCQRINNRFITSYAALNGVSAVYYPSCIVMNQMVDYSYQISIDLPRYSSCTNPTKTYLNNKIKYMLDYFNSFYQITSPTDVRTTSCTLLTVTNPGSTTTASSYMDYYTKFFSPVVTPRGRMLQRAYNLYSNGLSDLQNYVDYVTGHINCDFAKYSFSRLKNTYCNQFSPLVHAVFILMIISAFYSWIVLIFIAKVNRRYNDHSLVKVNILPYNKPTPLFMGTPSPIRTHIKTDYTISK